MMNRIFVMIISTALLMNGCKYGFAAEKQTMLNLDLAMALSLKKDVELSVLQNQWRVNAAELKALKMMTPVWVNDALLFPAPTKEDMAIRQRVEAIQSAQTVLEHQFTNRAAKLLNDTRQQYFEILIQEATADYAYGRIQDLQSAYAVLYPGYLKGLVKVDVLNQNQLFLKEANESFEAASGAAVTLRNTLALQIGSTSLGSTALELPNMLMAFTLNDKLLEALQQQATHQAIGVLEAEAAALKAERELNDLTKLYEWIYPQSVQGLKQALELPSRPYEAVFDAFLNMTNTSGAGLLLKQENPKAYPFVQGFSAHQLPLDWFSPLPNALAYWQQPPSPINSALVATDLRQHELRLAKDNLNKEIQTSFGIAQLTFLKQIELESGLKVSEAMLEKLKKANLIGVSRYEDVQNMQDLVKRSQLEVFKNRMTLYAQLSQLEYLSGGALGLTITEPMLNDARNTQTALDMPVQTMPTYGNAYWIVNNNEAKTQFEFRVKLPEKTALTHYQLFSAEGKALSKPLAIKSVCNHALLPYKENTYLTLVLYEKDKARYTFKISADAIAGKLNL